MVKILLPLLTLFSMLSAQISSITAEVDGREAIVSVPPQGTITITHHEQETIDISSFRMGNQPLSVQLLKEMRINPEDPYLITLYRFQLDPYPKGLHMLDSVS
ncbi:MAG: hypothetical protein KDK65_01540, partial [Chlamydiia bacterium]|nr:hypothetical protein [Chlamydiia bacterium]